MTMATSPAANDMRNRQRASPKITQIFLTTRARHFPTKQTTMAQPQDNIQLPSINPRLQLKIVELVEQRIDQYSKWAKTRMEAMEKVLLAAIRQSTNLLMKGVNNMTRLIQSRLMDAAFIRKASLRDPSLSERGCEIAAQLDLVENVSATLFTAIAKDRYGNGRFDISYNIGYRNHRCNDSKCDLRDLITSIFSASRGIADVNKTQLVSLICCPRHQYILESYTTIEIIANVCIKKDDKVAYINLIQQSA